MRGGPGLGVLQEMPYLLHLVGSEVAARLGDAERVPPGGQRVQRDPLLGEGGDAFGEDAVVKDDEGMRDRATGVADRIDEVQPLAPVGRTVLDTQQTGQTTGGRRMGQ